MNIKESNTNGEGNAVETQVLYLMGFILARLI